MPNHLNPLSLLLVYFTQAHNAAVLRAALKARFPASLLRRAIADGGRPGELPQLILLHTSPGLEEAMLAGI